MGILDPNCTKRLIERTADALKSVSVRNGQYLYAPSTLKLFFLDDALPSQGRVRKQLEGYVGERPFYEFVSESLNKLLITETYSPDESVVALTSLGQFVDATALATWLVDQFDSLPWVYDVTLVLPEAIGRIFIDSLGNTVFTDKLSLVALDDRYKAEYPIVSKSGPVDLSLLANSLLGSMMSASPSWPAGVAALRFRINGFVGLYGVSDPLQEAIDAVDSFFGLCIALNILYVSPKYQPTAPRLSAFVHKRGMEGWEAIRRHELDASQSQAIVELAVNPSVESAPPEQRRGYFQYLGQRLTAIFQDPSASRQIISAAKWFFNSYGSKDALLSFVQGTVVLEILLGEEVPNEKIGLSELLRNRCAYLVANNYTERDELMKQFTEIYGVRSKIVHRGKSRLTRHEAFLLSELRTLGKRVLAKEIELLLAAKAKQ